MRILLLIGILCLSTFMTVAQDKSTNYIDRGSPVPPLNIKNRTGVNFSTADVIEDRNYMVVLFNPTCGHCIDLGKLVMDHAALFENNTIIFVTDSSLVEYFPHFVQESGWTDEFNRILGYDGDAIRYLYNDLSLPQVNIYSPQGTLLRSLNGIISLEHLSPYIKP